jgi:hypothetical protein
MAVGVKKSNNPFGLLKRLNQTVEQDAIEAGVMGSDMILVVLAECVHEPSPCREKQRD